MSVLYIYPYLCIQCPWKPKEGIKFSVTGAADSWEPPFLC